ncbi:OST-HTH/LOTUS domain-containing protein [uncultured Marinobacter sp.]|uniref:OST-HTH/LOTUS domain-containing protein n=1 Tax=uncultured Marinobacter sp. TaxID=187379 RepID=UPI0030C80E0F|tara:strand:- start:626 stop:1486 length:861 start_codon:yes stop_codon:yes gene_type:complete
MNDLGGENLEHLRAKIERGLGQCLLQLQRYELGLKRFLSTTVIRGNTETLEAHQEARKAHFSNKTLGQLIGELTGEYLVPSSPDEDSSPPPYEPLENPKLSEFQFRFSMSMTEERHETLRAELAEIVLIRNELVHHFLERFNLNEVSGCDDAVRHLANVQQVVAQNFERLKEWDKTRRSAAKQAAEFMQSNEFGSMLSYGVYPGLPIVWRDTTAVTLLKEAEEQLARDGWTDLKSAIGMMQQKRPDLGPKIYHCKTWRQLLKKSELFELRKITHQDETTSTLFCSR